MITEIYEMITVIPPVTVESDRHSKVTQMRSKTMFRVLMDRWCNQQTVMDAFTIIYHHLDTNLSNMSTQIIQKCFPM